MYTTSAKVRAILPTLLINDDDLGISYSGTNLTLTYPAFDVPTILINGVSSTAFTFKRPDNIALTSAATGQRFIAQTYIGIEDSSIDVIIAMVDRAIDAKFSQYETPSGSYLEDWSSQLTAAKYLRMYATATEENLDRAKALEDMVTDEMKEFQNTSGNESYIIVKVNS